MKKLILALSLFTLCCIAEAKITLSPLFSDNMVLQQKSDVTFYGQASAGKEITIRTGWKKRAHYSVKADQNGNWEIKIPTPSAGGPYEISLSDGEECVLKNILIGEVWLYSGEEDNRMQIEGASHPAIRLFQMKKAISLVPEKNVFARQKGWQECNVETAATFPAEAYFFASQLQKALKVPVGVIECTWKDTPIEAWSSYDALTELPAYTQQTDMLEALGFDPKKIEAAYEKKKQEWYQALYEHDMGWCDDHQVWAEPNYPDENWKEMELPGCWEEKGMKDFDGVVWFRKAIHIPRTWARKTITLDLGKINDEDIVYYNGVEIGRTQGTEINRQYTVPYKLVKRGKAVLTIRVTNYQGKGGLCGKSEDLKMSIKGKEPLSLAGNWKYLTGLSLSGIPALPVSPATNPSYPTGLFNAMIHPLIHFPIKGILWHQGVTDCENAEEYADLFLSLIADWRDKWKQADMPFLFVQLGDDPQQSDPFIDTNRALLREAQAQALYLNHTGMAVTTDINPIAGHNSLHSRLEIGFRLSQLALRQAYRKKKTARYPTYSHHRIEDNTIRLRFENIGKGFLHPEGPVQGFIIAGTDHVFYPATVILQKKEVIVHSPDVPHPVAVRYNWADSPDGTLTGASGLPVAPFRTDKW